MEKKPVVLFVCVHNAGRSQMAAALLERVAHGEVEVLSAGSAPAWAIHDNVLRVMAELNIDLSAERPKLLTDSDVQRADVVVTMGCGDACPVYPGKRYLDWDLPDPAGRTIEDVRMIRSTIEALVKSLTRELLATADA